MSRIENVHYFSSNFQNIKLKMDPTRLMKNLLKGYENTGFATMKPSLKRISQESTWNIYGKEKKKGNNKTPIVG